MKKSITDLIKSTEHNYKFDTGAIRNKLLVNLESLPTPNQTPRQRTVAMPAWFRGFSLVTASVVLFVSLGIGMAVADQAKPGDRMFALDQLQERIMLIIPMRQSTKAQIRANIVQERASELSQIEQLSNHEELKLKALKTSQESLTQAVEQITKDKTSLSPKTVSDETDDLNQVLLRLELLAREQEERAKAIHIKMRNQKLKDQVSDNLDQIKKTRLKVKLEIIGPDNDQDEDQAD